ncbi:MAG: putative penicillin-binding protein [Chloroflexi bacterium OLB15]|nr:MAG: putative penicillin-binding protein [Chloroflexi bacterium OLB15]
MCMILIRLPKSFLLIRLSAVVALAFAASSCGTLPITGASSGENAPNLLQAAQSPTDVATLFIEAWGRSDYAAMYALLAPQSQQLTTAPVFQQIYETADAAIGTNGASIANARVEEQGQTALVRYDATIGSNTFGDIEDEGRAMRLVNTPNGWRVAWSTMDIFDDYAPGTTLDSFSRRAPRGNIYARDGQPLVEQDSTVVTVYVTRGAIPDEEACLTTLSYALLTQRGDFVTMFADYNFETQFPVGDIDPDKYEEYSQALAENCAAVTTTRETRRYAGHGAAAHITGYIGGIPSEQVDEYAARGYDFGELVGLGGIEAQYEEELAGDARRVLRIVEPGGMTVREIASSDGAAPMDVYTTIDYDLQMAAGQAMADAYNYAEGNWASREHSTGGGVVVLDIASGEVLALASYPTFDPGIFNPDTPYFFVGDYIISLGGDARQPFLNRVIQNSYAPGSTFKIITAAAAAEEGVWDSDQIFDCTRIWYGSQYGDTREERYDWRNFEPEEANFDTGEVTMADALTASCNPFFYTVGALLYRDRGPSTLTDYARRMGLGSQTGINVGILPEAAGNVPLPRGVDAAISEAIGQGDIQVSLIQMARMVAGIANGGALYEPFIVETVGREGETPVFEFDPTITSEMNLSEETLEVVRHGMCQVTDSSVLGRTSGERLGTAWFVFTDPEGVVAPYTVCGKTGTAQTGRAEPHGWFVAFAPADDPQIAIAGVIEYGREGSETAAPIIRRILDEYFDVTPDQVAPYPEWWYENQYVPLNIPEGSTGV